ncbi:hypothetical protein DdX_00943 [Ditylenchus destructor]|uniref:Uncharacterized protein n=1 Tax=Ditylenchus destructor TaxID=166010 RepID=A0AAD4NEM1_9BILA|nr:hypothetical protein DdX_00943 [Ditylenchus destructor]
MIKSMSNVNSREVIAHAHNMRSGSDWCESVDLIRPNKQQVPATGGRATGNLYRRRNSKPGSYPQGHPSPMHAYMCVTHFFAAATARGAIPMSELINACNQY